MTTSPDAIFKWWCPLIKLSTCAKFRIWTRSHAEDTKWFTFCKRSQKRHQPSVTMPIRYANARIFRVPKRPIEKFEWRCPLTKVSIGAKFRDGSRGHAEYLKWNTFSVSFPTSKYSSRVGVLLTSTLETAYEFAENHTNSHVYAVDSK